MMGNQEYQGCQANRAPLDTPHLQGTSWQLRWHQASMSNTGWQEWSHQIWESQDPVGTQDQQGLRGRRVPKGSQGMQESQALWDPLVQEAQTVPKESLALMESLERQGTQESLAFQDPRVQEDSLGCQGNQD